MKLGYMTSQSSIWTFSQPRMKKWMVQHLVGRVINVFAGMNKIPGAVNCDNNPEMNPDVLIDAMLLETRFHENEFDTAVLDPPYSQHQIVTRYNGHGVHEITRVRDQLVKIVTKRLIWFGYNIPGTPGFKKTEILLINHGGDRNATICAVEDREAPRNNIICTVEDREFARLI